jgi:hypothetical protein
MNKTEWTFLASDLITATLVVLLTGFEAKGLMLFFCILGEVICTVTILLYIQLKIIGGLKDVE